MDGVTCFRSSRLTCSIGFRTALADGLGRTGEVRNKVDDGGPASSAGERTIYREAARVRARLAQHLPCRPRRRGSRSQMDVVVEEVSQVWGGRGRTKVVALDRFSHRFRSGRFSCLLGPSGCGKSTLVADRRRARVRDTGTVRIVRSGAPAADAPARRRFRHGVAEPQPVSRGAASSTTSPSASRCTASPRRERYGRARSADRLGRAARLREPSARASSPAACASASRSRARSSWSGRSC